jgi:hypothetical protein
MQSFASVIDLWPTATELAADIGEKDGTVRQWRNRDRIPAEFWEAIVGAAAARGFSGVTPEALARIAATNRRAAA